MKTLLLLLVVGLGALALALWTGWLPTRTSPASSATLAATALPPVDPQEQAIVDRVCSKCHLVPDPSDLPSTHWPAVLEEMSLFLGLEVAKLPNSRAMLDLRRTRLKELGRWQAEPLCTPEDFAVVSRHYLDRSPPELAPLTRTWETHVGIPGFEVAPIDYERPAALTTLVQIDAAHQEVWLGDSKYQDLTILGADGQRHRRFPVGGPPTALQREANGFLLTTIGVLPPDDRTLGKVTWYEASGDQYQAHPLLEDLPRTPHALRHDLDGDGDLDLVVSSFGNLRGRLHWYEQQASGTYAEHVWIDEPGALQCVVFDVDADGKDDVLALLAQNIESLVWFRQTQPGQFEPRDILVLPPGAGSTDLKLVDFDRDGFLDLLLVQGDNGDLNKTGGAPPLKPYHGIRVLRNRGPGKDDRHSDLCTQFQEKVFLPLHGATRAVAADFDQDGDVDIAAVAHYPNYLVDPVEGFVYFENQGGGHFERFTDLATVPGRWMTLDAGDLDGDGDVDLVLGAAYTGIRAVGIERWELLYRGTNQPAVLVLKNQHAGR